MPFPGVTVNIGENNLLANINVPDAVPAMLMSKEDVSEDKVVYDSVDDFGYYEISDFFAQIGGNTRLVLGGVEYVVDNAVQDVANFLGRNPDVNLVGLIWGGGTTHTPGNAVSDDIIALVPKLQAVLDARAATGHPVRLILGEASVATEALPSNKYKPHTVGCNRVSLVLGGSDDVTSGVGIALGRATKIAAHVKLGDGTIGPLAVDEIMYAGSTYDEVGAHVVEQLHDDGFLTFMRRAGREGWYFGVDNMCSDDDFSILAHGRVIDKAQRIAIAAYMPYVETPMQMADDGTIDIADAESMAKVIESQLRAQMSGQVSNVKVVVPTAQDLVNTHTLRVSVSVLPLGYNTWISVEMDLVSRL